MQKRKFYRVSEKSGCGRSTLRPYRRLCKLLANHVQTNLLPLLSALRTALRPLLFYTLRYPVRSGGCCIALMVGVLFYHCLPSPLFQSPTCTVLFSREGTLLAASIADDGQYRFPTMDSVPEKFATCAIAYEDQYFRYHLGVNPIALTQAWVSNLKAGHVVRGGSTLTMQVARMLHPRASRTYWNKLVEMVWAIRLECAFSKEAILTLYASHAPFGGNVVGLEAAAWRYYQTRAENLSWGQMAALAVLPNAPAEIYPGRASRSFQRKRDQLLRRLYADGVFDEETLKLALLEPLPEPPAPLPQRAWQLVNHAYLDGLRGQNIHTTLDYELQCEVERLVSDYAEQQMGHIGRNTGVVVADVMTGEILAYVGNVPGLDRKSQGYVDMITARRSSGSILKPFLYAGMLEDGLLLPQELVPDLPVKIGTFAPENASHQFAGAVHAAAALSRSLNIPSVHLLRAYGIDVFLELLRKLGATTFNRSADHYGLPLILGGGECTLWEMCGIYASLSRTLVRYTREEGRYFSDNLRPLRYIREAQKRKEGYQVQYPPLSASAIYLTFQALREVNRPEEESGWGLFSSTRSVAWKTGTSFGGRDAWAIGVNERYVVGVWNGNATGEGLASLSGVHSAAPLMFRIWGRLPRCGWFTPPYDDLRPLEVCVASGLPPNEHCTARDTIWIPRREYEYAPCPYHRLVHLDQTGRYRVHASCYPLAQMQHLSWFVLPPAMGWFYGQWNPTYRPLPPWLEGCDEGSGAQNMQFIYPRQEGVELSVPRDLDGKPSPVKFELAHSRPETRVFWHLDDAYLGETLHLHQMLLLPEEGEHTLTVVDEAGGRRSIHFRVVYRAR